MTTKTVFLYDETTGEYLGSYAAQPSPIEPGVFIEPTYSTELAPPTASAGEVVVFVSGAWTTQIVSIPATATVPTAAQLWGVYQAGAQVLLDKSDITVMRCFEAAIALPAAWVTYRKALRAIVGATSGNPTAVLPATPEYPAGT